MPKRIKELQKKLNTTNGVIKRWESRRDRLIDEIYSAEYEVCLDTIKAWKGNIDWKWLVGRKLPDSAAILEIFLLEQYGIESFGWCQTSEKYIYVLSLPARGSLNKNALKLVRTGIEFIGPYLEPVNGHFKEIEISTKDRDIEETHYLQFCEGFADVRIASKCLDEFKNIIDFTSLEAGVAYIQDNLYSYDVFENTRRPEDVPGSRGEDLRNALSAFEEGK